MGNWCWWMPCGKEERLAHERDSAIQALFVLEREYGIKIQEFEHARQDKLRNAAKFKRTNKKRALMELRKAKAFATAQDQLQEHINKGEYLRLAFMKVDVGKQAAVVGAQVAQAFTRLTGRSWITKLENTNTDLQSAMEAFSNAEDLLSAIATPTVEAIEAGAGKSNMNDIQDIELEKELEALDFSDAFPSGAQYVTVPIHAEATIPITGLASRINSSAYRPPFPQPLNKDEVSVDVAPSAPPSIGTMTGQQQPQSTSTSSVVVQRFTNREAARTLV